MLRKIIPLALLTGSVTIAAMIFFAKTPVTEVKNILPIGTNEPLPTQNSPAVTDASVQDAVQNIASGIAKEIVDGNPDGPVNGADQLQIIGTNPDAIAEKLLQSGAGIDYAKFSPEVKISDLHILATSNKNLSENYFKNAAVIDTRNFSGLSVDFTSASSDELKKLIAAYNHAIQELYSLNVPRSLADLHLEKIRLYVAEKNLFENVYNYQKDPMAAMLSLRLFGRAYDDLTKLNRKLTDFAVANNLDI